MTEPRRTARERLYRDPVHDLIILDLTRREDRVLAALIDSAEFQRLRRIRQLGMALMAFQGAEHSRFTHSIGVMHLSRRMIERLRREEFVEPRMALAVQCAALLHDVGHGPFSHVIEKFFTRHHESWTREIVAHPDTEIHRALLSYERDFPQDVLAVMDGTVKPRWLHSIVSSQLDADRFDYLLRDSHMTGVKYGVFDLERLLLMLRLHVDGERVVIAAKGLLPVEKYLQSRYQMYRQVYFHKAVTAAEAILMALLERAAELARQGRLRPGDSDSPFGRVLAGRDSLDVFDYLALDDSILMSAINTWARAAEDPILRDLSNRLLNRRLFKSIEVPVSDAEDLVTNARLERARELVAEAGLDPRYYFLVSRSADTPYRPYSTRGKSPIWVQDADDPSKLHDVCDISPTIRAFTENYEINRVFFPASAGDRDLRQALDSVLRG